MGLLTGEIASAVHAALKAILYDITLTPQEETEDGSGGFVVSDGTPVTAKGATLDYTDAQRQFGQIPDGDRLVLLLQNSFTGTPKRGDKLTDSNLSESYLVVSVKQDPAKATWELQARPWPAA